MSFTRAVPTTDPRSAPCEGGTSDDRHRAVVIGGGFGGLQAVARLRRAAVGITLIDRRGFHLFQPLTYQAATGALSPGESAYPLRAIFKRNRNVRVVQAEVTGFDLEARLVRVEPVQGAPPMTVAYDMLIVGAGSRYPYVGHDEGGSAPGAGEGERERR